MREGPAGLSALSLAGHGAVSLQGSKGAVALPVVLGVLVEEGVVVAVAGGGREQIAMTSLRMLVYEKHPNGVISGLRVY